MNKDWNTIRQFSKRNRILKDIGYETYQDFLKSAEWITTKDEIARRVKKGKLIYSACWCCGSKDNLQLHHLKYNKLNLSGGIGGYLRMVCNNCHEIIHLMTRLDPKVSIKAATKRLRKKNKKLGAPLIGS